ncbi:pilus assembly PilX family protein [Steroidobacter cummioxidans]|uniref:pilus assembly PilX family protein n=1 Tax=Steroidobacter cummioxidans TaxID=1803913 RepID=UPI00137ABCF4|nr:PilX N-terminal domain-containing pilus assembly protein [Steroidobacter cummioxidans]
MKQQTIPSARRQRGAVLIVSMLLLLVITILALGASQSTRLQERMAGSQRNFELAFQAAEAGLRAGERWLDRDSLVEAPSPGNAAGAAVYERNFLTDSYASRLSYEDQVVAADEWWNTVAQPYTAGAAAIGGNGLALADPRFYIEQVEEVPDALSKPPAGPQPSRIFYRVVARGKGGTQNANVVLHSTYVRRFN